MSDLGTAETDAVLRLLLDGQPRTRAELIDLSGLARSTVTGRIEALLASGLVVPSGEAASTGGRPPARFRFNPTARLILAADVGATHVSVALTDLTGEILDRSTTRLNIAEGPEVVLSEVARMGRVLLRAARRSVTDLAGTGVGLPGPVEHSTGRPDHPPIMPGWDSYDVVGRLSREHLGPVLVDNDVNIMALGEHATEYAEVEHLLFVKVATGIGAGVISGGPAPSRGPGRGRGHRAHPGARTPRGVPLREHGLSRGGRVGHGRRRATARRRAGTVVESGRGRPGPGRQHDRDPYDPPGRP